MVANISVIFYSRSGTMRQLASAAAAGARAAGASVRLRELFDDDGPRVPAPEPAAGWDDLLWAHGLVFATPTYYGNVAYPVKRFIDSTSPLWRRGALADRVVTGLTSSTQRYGGREGTLLSLYRSMYHWGLVTMGADQPDARVPDVEDNPYGLAIAAAPERPLAERQLAAARRAGGRLGGLAARVRGSIVPDPSRPAVRVAVVYHSVTGSTRTLATAVAEGARLAGAQVRLRQVDSVALVPAADVDDLRWADAVAFGAPARLGGMASELMRFLELAEARRPDGWLAGKPTTGFTATARPHEGSESALLALYQVMHQFGALVVPPGYTAASVNPAGGNPYGTSHAPWGDQPMSATLAAAGHQGTRLAALATRLSAGQPVALVHPGGQLDPGPDAQAAEDLA